VRNCRIDIEMLRRRAEFIQLTRNYFIQKGYLEVETPILAPALIPEPSLEVFKTIYLSHFEKEVECFLIPSPELWMKRLLAHGSGNIFQVTKSFRNHEPAGKQHNPEFTLLEWYSIDHSYMDEIQVAEDLIRFLIKEMNLGRELDPPFSRLSMREAFSIHAGVDLDSAMSEDAIRKVALSLEIEVKEDESWEEIFQRLFLTRVEPALGDKPVILYDYPAGIPTLARRRGMYAERWELYLRGVEIANCYTEETSMKRLKQLFITEGRRKKVCRVQHPLDNGLLEAFCDFPSTCAGVALGMDRLFMVVLGFVSIERVLPFPFSKIFL
jgi:lysyl-tRNA synthetase class 2